MLCKMQINSVRLVVFAGLLTLSQAVVQPENGSSENSSTTTTTAISGGAKDQSSSTVIASRSSKAISFFPSPNDDYATEKSRDPAGERGGGGERQVASRRIRFGEEDANYVNSNDISGSTIEIGERRPVYAYKRPDDGSVFNSQPNYNSNNYYSQPYEYAYNEQGQYSTPQQADPNYYSQNFQQSNHYYRPQQAQAQSQPQGPPSRPPLSQTYHQIPYQSYAQQQQQPSSGYQQQQQQNYQRPPPPQYQNPQRPIGPYYQQQQQRPRPPQGAFGNYQSGPQYDNYSPNYPYQPPGGGGGGGGFGDGGGGLLGGLGSLFGNDNGGSPFGGGGGGGGGGVGGQFGYAIENIVRYDDYQCVPKIVCQMVGNPQRQTNLPGWLNAPTLTALISAVPSTSPMLVFGRAALLGLSGGERNCDSSYPRCPRNEDDVLNYLNNHRGGFFRFFNGGASYGDEAGDYGGYDQQQQQYQPQQQQQYDQQYQQPAYQQQQQQQLQGQGQSPLAGIDLGTLSSLAEAINSGGGINLSNLGSNLGLLGNLASLGSALGGGGSGATPVPQKATPASSLGSNLGLLSSLGSQLGLGDTVSNLLTGIVGARFKGRSARKLSKRSVESSEEDIDDTLDKLLLSLGDDKSTVDRDLEGPPSKKRNLNKEIGDDATVAEGVDKSSLNKRKKYHQEGEKKEKIRTVEKILGIQARIINKEEIEAAVEGRIMNHHPLHSDSLLLNPIIFPEDYQQNLHSGTTSHGVAFPPFQDAGVQPGSSAGFFPEGVSTSSLEDNRGGKAYQYSHSTVHQSPAAAAPLIPYNPLQFPENFQNNDGIILDIPKPLPLEYYDRTKMIFPDRTGTGNLRFDNEVFQNQHPHFNRNPLNPVPINPNILGHNLIRIGRILTGSNQNRPLSYQQSFNEQSAGVTYNRGDVLVFHNNRDQNNNYNGQSPRPQFDFGNRYPIFGNGNNNPYQVNGNRPQSTDYYGNNRYQQTSSNQDSGNKVYVTNGQGIVTYYLNERGEKIAV